MFERYTDRARRVLVNAQVECDQLGSEALGSEHLLLGMLRDAGSAASAALQASGITLDALRRQLGDSNPLLRPPDGGVPFTPDAKQALERALREALRLGDSWIGTVHLLLGVLRTPSDAVSTALANLGVDPEGLREKAMDLRALEAGDLTEVDTRPDAASRSTAAIPHHNTIEQSIAAFQGPIFGILVPDLGPPRAGRWMVGGTELQRIGVEYEDIAGRSWRPLAYVDTTYRDRIQGAVAIGGNPTPEERERRLREVMEWQRQNDLDRPPALRFEEILDYAFQERFGDRAEDVDLIETGRIELMIEGVATAVETWSAGPWCLGAFEGEFKERLVGVKLGIHAVAVSNCMIGYVADLHSLAGT